MCTIYVGDQLVKPPRAGDAGADVLLAQDLVLSANTNHRDIRLLTEIRSTVPIRCVPRSSVVKLLQDNIHVYSMVSTYSNHYDVYISVHNRSDQSYTIPRGTALVQLIAEGLVDITVVNKRVREISVFTDRPVRMTCDGEIVLTAPDSFQFVSQKAQCVDLATRCVMLDEGTGKYVSYYMRPYDTSVYLANTTGVIDSTYRGNLKAYVMSIARDSVAAGEPFMSLLHPDVYWDDGKRVTGRMYIPTVFCIHPFDDTVAQTTRGSDGFGSTGRTAGKQ